MSTSESGSRPAAQGSLKDRPVPRLLQQIFRKRVTGTLVVRDETEDITRVFVREGAPVHAERPNDIDRLDNILVERGFINLVQAAEANREVISSGRRLGDLLVVKGLLTREALADVLKAQMRRKVTRLFFSRGGTFEIFTDAHSYGAGDELTLMRVDPRCILYPGIRAAYDDGRLRDELKPLADHRFRLVSIAASFLEAMGFAKDDPVIVALRARWLTLEDLGPLHPKPSEARAVVLALLYTDLLDTQALAGQVVDESAAPPPEPNLTPVLGVPVPPASTPPGGVPLTSGLRTPYATPIAGVPLTLPPQVSPWQGRPGTGAFKLPDVGTPIDPAAARPPTGSYDLPNLGTPASQAPSRRPSTGTHAIPLRPEELRAQIADMSSRLDQLSHFELLGLPEAATSAEVNSAYMRLARQFHPDRLASANLRELAPQAERIMARVGEASAVLSDPQRRTRYIAERAGKADPSAGAILEGENVFQKGEVFMRKGDYAQALGMFVEAARLNPLEPTYRAYMAWARFEDPRARKETIARETLGLLKETLQQRPQFARGHFWVGQVWKHLNDMDQAEKAFREAMRVEKGFLEAEREVRLIEMRRQKPTSARAPAGTASAEKPNRLLGKFFKGG